MLVPAVTCILYAWEYNQRFFSQGSAAKGIINFKGAVPEKQLQSFRRHWYQMISGVENAWYINLQQTSRDMEYNSWMDFLIKVVCAMYAMDPAELNFKYGNVGQKGGLQESSNREKITESKERGLRPLLRFIADAINLHLVWPVNENFEFDFVGLDAQTKDEMAELSAKQVRVYKTVDEIRAQDDLPPLPDGLGEVLLDPTWYQHAQQKQAQAQQAENPQGQMGEGEPEGGAPGGEPEGEEQGMDFKKLLQQYGQGGGEKSEGGNKNTAEPAKPAVPAKAAAPQIAKSFGRGRRIFIDLNL
jgi:hypothetical protein